MKEKLSDYGINGDDNSKEYSNPKTAVEYLWDMLIKGEFINDPEELFLEAKEMQDEQMQLTWNNAIDAVQKDKWESYDDFYNHNFKAE
jgi:hypothetical protein